MGDFRIRVTRATRRAGELQGPEHDFEDTLHVFAMTAQSARYAAVATWPDIRTVHSVRECWY